MIKLPFFSWLFFAASLLWIYPAGSAENLFDQFKELIKKDIPSKSLSNLEIGKGLKEALKIGTERVVKRVASTDGYFADPSIHIPLPESLKNAQSIFQRFGLSGMADDLEKKLNRAAEAAAPQAKTVFWQAVEQMTLEDVKSIYKGPSDAATKYFQDKMTGSLKEEMRPVIEKTLAGVGAIKSYDDLMGKYRSFPFVPDVKANLTDYGLGKALDGLFYYLAKEEAAIRQNPAKRTTEILRKVFGK